MLLSVLKKMKTRIYAAPAVKGLESGETPERMGHNNKSVGRVLCVVRRYKR